MLEFIIALLLSLGINVGDKSSLPLLDADTMNMVQSDSRYQELGGDQEFEALFKQTDSGSNGEDDIVPTIDPNPSDEKETNS
ncbi:MAG: hypothetical protein EYC69_14045 [Bacteroidetes bacterium]|nr:MAG: hypothetical protein EYC69_14045 [Bacteroidota bacterium]